ncbi:SDR family oxidoreductase [Streptomyces sp. NPDC018045]|uniref:type I polyketide synthase n=1 Tax=Streptomyces sp. NPDC018045 TaxID=3365037 RepID=UPI0037A8267E
MADSDLIAVIGLSGRFPGACDIDEFWHNISSGTVSIERMTDDQLRAAGAAGERVDDPAYIPVVATAGDLDMFDPGFFDMTQREAETCDPQFRLFLECCHDALLNAGLRPGGSWDVGVFGSAGTDHYADLLRRSSDFHWRSTRGMAVGTGNNLDYLATLVSYKLGLRGPAVTVQTACSSSLVAVHQAAQALLSGECEVALAGGADIELPLGSGYMWDEGGPLSRDGMCRPFDADATGTVFGSGGGVVVLKRLDDALAHRDPVRAVIRGSAVNNDGDSKVGFTAPSVLGQAAVISEAMLRADVAPADIRMVEAHATGTYLGDPIEVASLVKAFTTLGSTGGASCALGSVKGNIGHLGHASGVTSLIKTVLCLENGIIAASGSFHSVNPKLGLEDSPFYVAGEREDTGSLSVAGVSSFGMGGTNAHAIVERAPVSVRAGETTRPVVLLWSAADASAREAYQRRLRNWTIRHDDAPTHVAASLRSVHDQPYDFRGAVLVNPAEVPLDVALADGSPAVQHGDTGHRVGLVSLFPATGGRGEDRWQGLTDVHPAFDAAFDSCCRHFDRHGIDLAGLLRQAEQGSLPHPALDLPLTFAIAYATAALWQTCGVESDAVLGHGVGEVTAAVVCGILTLDAGIAVVAAQTHVLADCAALESLLVAAAPDEIGSLLTDGVGITAVHSRQQLSVAGAAERIAALAEELRRRGVRSRSEGTVSTWGTPAAHAVPDAVFAALRGHSLTTRPGVTFYASSLGAAAPMSALGQADHWARLAVRAPDFGKAAEAALAGACLLLETGAGRTLTAAVRQHPLGKERAVASLPGEGGQRPSVRTALLRAATVLWAKGHTVGWDILDPLGDVVRAPLPGYAYQRRLCWPKPTATQERPAAAAPAGPAQPTGPWLLPHWKVAATSPHSPAAALPDGVTAVLVADTPEAAPLADALAGDGDVVIRVSDRHQVLANGVRVVRRDHLTADLGQLHTDLHAEGRGIHRLVHALTFTSSEGSLDEELTNSYRSIVAAVRSFFVHKAARAPELVVLTSGAADVSGQETVTAGRAALAPLVRTLLAEGAVSGACLIDAPVTAPGARILRHVRVVNGEVTVLALRGDLVWTPAELPLDEPECSANTWRAGGTYLLTGGYGALAGVVAQQISLLDPQATLVLLGRTARPLTDAHLAAREQGARLIGLACDITDREAVRATVAEVRGDFGEIRAVVHLAGSAGSGIAVLTDADRTAAALGPKVAGTVNLLEALKEVPAPKAFIAFSSRSALGGQPGGGDYAVANAVMDALVRRGTPAERSVSVNWPAWRDIGMAANLLRTEQGRQERDVVVHTTDVRLETLPGSILDEHRIHGVPVMPATGTLDLVMRTVMQYRDDDGPFELRDVVFNAPLAVPEPCTVTVELRSDTAGGLAFRVTPADDSTVTYACGLVPEYPGPRPQPLDVAGLRSRITTAIPEGVGDEGSGMVTFGPHWRAATALWADGEHGSEKLLNLQVPEEYVEQAAGFTLHPVLLDCATASVHDPRTDASHLPFRYRTITRYAPIPERAYAWIRRTGATGSTLVADVDIADAEGRVAVRVRGFTMLRVAEADLRVENRPPSSVPSPMPPVRGIPVELAAALVRTVLTSGLQGQVSLHQYVDGHPAAAKVVADVLPSVPEAAGAAGAASPQDRPAGLSTFERLKALWQELLGESSFPAGADFFDLGGNSLTAVELMDRIQDEFGFDLDLDVVFDSPTLAGLAEVVDAGKKG